MLTKIERGHEDFDVVCPSEYIIERMLKKDLLLPIDTNFANTPNYLKNQSPYIREKYQRSKPTGETGRTLCHRIHVGNGRYLIQQKICLTK